MVNPTNRAPDRARANDARTHRKVAEAFTRFAPFAQRPISSSSDARISGSVMFLYTSVGYVSQCGCR